MPASDAHVGALIEVDVERACASAFGAMFAQNTELLRIKLAPPFLGRLFDFEFGFRFCHAASICVLEKFSSRVALVEASIT